MFIIQEYTFTSIKWWEICQKRIHISLWAEKCACSKGTNRRTNRKIMKNAKKEDSNDIVMTVPFDEKTLTWKTDSNG